MFSNKHMKRNVSILVVGVAALVIATSVAAAGTAKVTRIIDLAAVEASPHIASSTAAGQGAAPPNATVTIVSYSEFNDEGRMDVQGLRRLGWNSNASYTLYLTAGNSPEDYRAGEPGNAQISFNVLRVGNNLHGAWLGGGFPPGLSVDTPTITAFIAFDPDDGSALNPLGDMDRVVFVGTSVLQ